MHGEPDDALPRGGWFVRWVDRPESPLRLKWFVIVGAVAGVAVAVGTGTWMWAAWPDRTADRPALSLFLALMAGWGAFCVVSLVGIVAQALVRLSVYGPEWSVNRAAIRHDFPLRRTWVAVVELLLLALQAAMMVWSLGAFVRQGSWLGLGVFALLCALTFWPFIRYRLLSGRWPD